jgi:DNA repair protein RadD
MLKLRDYQREAVNAVYDAFDKGVARPLVAMPTGSGKSPTLCTFVKEALEYWPDQRILSIVHVKELVEQNVNTMLRIWPEAPISIYSAGLKSKDLSGQVVFASIQSIFRRAYDLQKVDLIIVDECHLLPASGDGMYLKLLEDLAVINGGPIPMVGFTATPFRTTSGSLIEGRGRVFDSLCYEIGILPLIERGFLVPPVTKGMVTQFDTSKVGTRAGEFIQSELQEAVDREHLVESACDEIVAYGHDRKCWLAYSTGVQHAHHIAAALRRRGVSCGVVSGETPMGERNRLIQAHKAGEIRCLANDSILTTGYDNPQVDMLAVLRPTKSAGLWQQICGRALRPAPDKKNALILDFGRNSFRFGPLDKITGKVKGPPRKAPVKECPECKSVVPASTLTCPDCFYQWPDPEREREKHDARAAATPLLSTQIEGYDDPDWIPVKAIDYALHPGKDGKPPSLRVNYRCGMNRISQWICVEHHGYPRDKARMWWSRREPHKPAPQTALEALARASSLPKPVSIKVRQNGQFFDVLAERF